MKAEALVIHLARAEKRRSQVERLMVKLPLATVVIDAVDGLGEPDEALFSRYRRVLHGPRYPFELRRQEIACFLSHRKAWSEIVKRGLDAGLVVEDDVDTDEVFGDVLEAVMAALQPRDLIRFPRWSRGEQGFEIARSRHISIIEPGLPGLGMQMQLIGREAARSLLEATEQFDRPVDTTVQMRWLHSVRILSARPIAIREIHPALGGTVIQKKAKPYGEVLSREVKRSLYRLAVRMENSRRRAADSAA